MSSKVRYRCLSHEGIINNPYLHSNRPLQSKIDEGFRKSVIPAVDEELINNPFLHSNRPLESKIGEDFRKSVILAVEVELTKRVAETQEYNR